MALKAILESIEGVAPDVAKEYVKGEDGKFRLDVTGMVESSKLAEFRDNNISLKQQLEQFNGIDPTKYKELQGIEQQLKESKLVDAGKIDELVSVRTEQMKTQHSTEVNSLSDKLNVATRQLESLLIDSAVRSASTTAGVLPTAVDDILLRAKSVFKIQDGQAVPMNDKGQIIYGQDAVSPMTVAEWMKGVSKSAPHLFQGTTGGGGRGGKGGQGGQGGQNRTALQKISDGLN